MPGSTPVYGITYPVDTDKVADGAAAIQDTAETVEAALQTHNTEVSDQLAVAPHVSKGLLANRPAQPYRSGDRYLAIDTDQEFVSDGAAWHEILTAAAGNAAYPLLTGIATASVQTTETIASASFTDLATVGPAVTVTVPASGRLRITFGAQMFNATANAQCLMSFALTGANTRAALALVSDLLSFTSSTASADLSASRTVILTGLTPGSTTVTCKYRSANPSTSVASFAGRNLIVEAI